MNKKNIQLLKHTLSEIISLYMIEKTNKNAPWLTDFEKHVVSIARDLINKLEDPLVLFSDNVDISDFNIHNLILNLIELRNDEQSTYKSTVLTNSITTLKNIQNKSTVYDGDISINNSIDENSINGKLRQLEIKQFDINNSISESLEKIDKRTGDSENYLKRVERGINHSLRKEQSEITEQNKEILLSIFEDGRKELKDISESSAKKLHIDIDKKSNELSNNFNIKYETLLENVRTKTEIAIQELNDANEKFDDTIGKQQASFETSVLELINKVKEEEVKFKDRLNETIISEIGKYKSARRLLKEQIKQAEDIVGILSKKAMAHEHLRQARQEYINYWIFQGTGLLFLFFAILMSVAIFGDSLGLKLPWLSWLIEFQLNNGSTTLDPTKVGSEASWFFKRISIILLLTAPGLYLLKEAAGHRAKENLYRQRGIQLAAISPYLSELEPNERNAVKKDLVKSFFSFHDGKVDTKNVPDFIRDLKETTKIIRSLENVSQKNISRPSRNRNRRNNNKATQG
ncbi:hypothetical protein [Aliivibrio fischeri]|uniref:Uncharacterized protein n=1 Tax=Aliivibrio fischeri TaxID=668 RepID=A0A844P416_ALIFS|nr:hypothetical protein [Aliivibrio fischeri]MUJ22537.1 hypothetical protein [Aliivibrio fischeri]MUK50104.1 hypothetical protein [Aliivibrio fischeri]